MRAPAEDLIFNCFIVRDPMTRTRSRFPTSDLEGYAQKATLGDAVKVLSEGNCGLFLLDPDLDPYAAASLTVVSVYYARANGALRRARPVVGMSYEDAGQLDHNFGENIVITGDMRDDPDPAAVLTSADINLIYEEGFEDYPDIEILATVPDPIAVACGVDEVLDAELRAFFDTLGAQERSDVDSNFDILNAMSHGRVSLDRPRTSLNTALSDDYRSLAMSGVVAHRALIENPEYKHLYMQALQVKDLSDIWQAFQISAGIGVRLPQTTRYADASPADFILSSMNRVADMLGIWHAVDAYFAGVPVADIIADMARS